MRDALTMRALRDTCRRETRDRPTVARLALTGVGMLLLGAGLAASVSLLLAELIGGLALLPVSLAVFFRLLPPPPWSDPDDVGGPGWGGNDSDRPQPSSGPVGDTDWERFERQFRAYVERRELAQDPARRSRPPRLAPGPRTQVATREVLVAEQPTAWL
jgi:hypothetical protein